MDFSTLTSRAGKVVSDNSPAILTAIGVTGAVTAAILTGKASFRAAGIIAEENERIDEASKTIEALSEAENPLDTKTKFNLVWKEYIPAAVIGTLSVTAIISANRIGNKRAAALATAYSLLHEGYDQYKEKVLEQLGKNKEEQVRVAVTKDKMERNPIPLDRQEFFMAPGNELWFDARTGRWFRSDRETVRAAVNDINKIILDTSSACLSDFYELIGLPPTSESDELGWTTDTMLDIKYVAVPTEHGAAMSIEFNSHPVREFYRFH